MPAVVKLNSASTGDPCGAPPRVPTGSSGDVTAENQPVVRQGDAYTAHACPGDSTTWCNSFCRIKHSDNKRTAGTS